MANWYAVIYCNSAAGLDSLSLADKESIRDRYVPQVVLDSPQWAASSQAAQWNWIKKNIIPQSIKNKIAKLGALPILYHQTKGFEVFQDWWKLAQEGTKFVFLVSLDYDSSLSHIRSWLDSQSGLLHWYGTSVWDAFRNLWQDRGTQPQSAIIKKIINYPVETNSIGVPVAPGLGTGTKVAYVTIGDAETLGYTIETSVLTTNRDKVLPVRLLGH